MVRKKVIRNPYCDQPNWANLQEEDVLEHLKIKQKEKLKPLTKGQEQLFKAIETSVITIVTGPAGSGRTYISSGIASQMLKENRIEKIIITRPLITCGNGLGWLPGDCASKTTPFMMPLLDAFSDFFTTNELEKLIKDDIIEIIPLELMRGKSIKNSMMILDESQNCEYKQLHCFLTRLGENSRIVINGDISQSDIEGRSPLADVIGRLQGMPEISIVTLTEDDIVRHGLIREINRRLSL